MKLHPEILMVEDDENDILIALRALKRHQLRDKVAIAHDGEEALEMLGTEGTPPRVMLLDLRMPRLDGMALLRRLRASERTRTLPVVVVSSSAQPRDIEESYRLGANSYVCKQYDPARPGEYLVDVVRYWLGLNCPAAQPAGDKG